MRDTLRDDIDSSLIDIYMGKDFNPNQPRGPHTGEWIDTNLPDLPSPSGPFGGSETSAADSEWNTGGCGEFAVALQELYPGLKLGGAYIDPEREYIGHAWAYDEAGHRYDIFGGRPGLGKKLSPGEVKSGGSIALDLTPDDLVGGGLQLGRQYIEEAKGVVRGMFG